MIKLIASDIDGTLVADGTDRINEELFDVIRRLRERGMQFAAASGRQAVSIERLFDPIREKIFYLAENGSYVGCYGRELFTTTIEHQVVCELIQDIRDTGCEVMLSGPRVAYMDTSNLEFIHWMVDGYHYNLKQVIDLTKVEDKIIKVAAYESNDVFQKAGHLMEKYRGRVKIAISGDMWMDCTALEVNKGRAIQLLQESLNIMPEETIVFGDQLNDIEMLKQAYYSFAIGNARKEVKDVARFMADTNINDGVLKVLKGLL